MEVILIIGLKCCIYFCEME